MAEYVSLEQRIIPRKIYERVPVSARFVISAAYGTVVSFFRIPTLIRKLNEKETFSQRMNSSEIVVFTELARATGLLATAGGLAAVGTYTYDAVRDALEGNYIRASILVGTNFASGIYEAVRRSSKSSKETFITSDRHVTR